MKTLLFTLIFGATAALAQTPPSVDSAISQSAKSANVAQSSAKTAACSDATFDELKSAFNELEGLLNEAQENPKPFENTDLTTIQQFIEEKGALQQSDFSESEALAVLEKINAFNNELAEKLLE